MSQCPDEPMPFGYKMAWFAIPSPDTQAVITALNLSRPVKAGWNEGIKTVYHNPHRVYVTPPIDGWTLVVGGWAFDLDQNDSTETAEPTEQILSTTTAIRAVEELLIQLSLQFSEAQGFATHRIIDYHHWILAREGQLVRSFAWWGEVGKVLVDLGAHTPAEAEFDWHALLHPVRPQSCWWSPDEDDVMAVAAQWSIDPTEL